MERHYGRRGHRRCPRCSSGMEVHGEERRGGIVGGHMTQDETVVLKIMEIGKVLTDLPGYASLTMMGAR